MCQLCDPWREDNSLRLVIESLCVLRVNPWILSSVKAVEGQSCPFIVPAMSNLQLDIPAAQFSRLGLLPGANRDLWGLLTLLLSASSHAVLCHKDDNTRQLIQQTLQWQLIQRRSIGRGMRRRRWSSRRRRHAVKPTVSLRSIPNCESQIS